MNAIFIMMATTAILGLILGLFGYIRMLRLHKLVTISGKPLNTEDLDSIYFSTIFFGVVLFIACGIACIGVWKTSEVKYQECIEKTRDTVYCSRYLKD